MKKMFILFFIMFFSCINVFAENDLQKVNIYLFTKDGCPHCTEAEAFFEELKEDKTYGNMFNLNHYQVYNSYWEEDATNAAIMNSIAEKMGDTVEGVPYIVIADDYSVNGYASSMDQEIKDAILNNYRNNNFVDIKDVDDLENSNDLITDSYSDYDNFDETNSVTECIQDCEEIEKEVNILKILVIAMASFIFITYVVQKTISILYK